MRNPVFWFSDLNSGWAKIGNTYYDLRHLKLSRLPASRTANPNSWASNRVTGAATMTRGNIVLLHGTVMGPGQIARCEVLARKVAADEGNGPQPQPCAFTDCSVIGAPTDLPDGEYVIRFEGYSFTAACHHGIWFSRSPTTKIDAVDAHGAQLADNGRVSATRGRDAA